MGFLFTRKNGTNGKSVEITFVSICFSFQSKDVPVLILKTGRFFMKSILDGKQTLFLVSPAVVFVSL